MGVDALEEHRPAVPAPEALVPGSPEALEPALDGIEHRGVRLLFCCDYLHRRHNGQGYEPPRPRTGMVVRRSARGVARGRPRLCDAQRGLEPRPIVLEPFLPRGARLDALETVEALVPTRRRCEQPLAPRAR